MTVVLLAAVVLLVVVLLARPELALLPLERILSPICWAWMETLLTSGVFDVRFLLPINHCVKFIIEKLKENVYLKSRVVRAGRVGTSPSAKVSGVVDETAGRNRLAVVLVGVRRIVVASSTDLAVVVVVVVGLAGRRANNPASPLVDATLASVDDVVFNADWLSSTSALLFDSLVTVRVVVVLTPGRRPLIMLATAADPALFSILTGVSVVVVVVRTDGRRAKSPANPPGVDGASVTSVMLTIVVGTSSSDSSFVSSATIDAVVVVVRTPGRRPLTRLASALALLLVAVAGTTDSVSTATSVMALAVVIRPAPGLRPPNRLVIPLVPLFAAWVSLDEL